MTASEILQKYISFFEKRGHARIINSSLVPENDPTTLFTSSGMQPLVPYLLGEAHPQGKRLVNVQNCFRAQDIDEIGDNRHTTFFRMLGNWSLGEYFKKEQIPWFWKFLTLSEEGLGLDPKKLYVTVFEGNNIAPKDTEAELIWTEIFEREKLDPKERIFKYGVEKNWWSRSGTPDKMPIGEIGGSDSEVFYDFGKELGLHEKSLFKNEKCHPNCDCGRFLEIGNSVFMEFIKAEDGFFRPLPQLNVDFGGGLERLVAATENQPDIFKTHLFSEAINSLQAITKTDLSYESDPKPYRVIVDHLNAATFMVSDGVTPSNKGQGYILRRLIRRAMVEARKLGMEGDEWLSNIAPTLEVQNNIDGSLEMDTAEINKIVTDEVDKFRKTLEQGLKQFRMIATINGVSIDDVKSINGLPINQVKTFNGTPIYKKSLSGKEVFALYSTYGFPVELTLEIAKEKGIEIDTKSIKEELGKHQELSRSGAAQKFAGGLADHSEKTIMGHTATHLLHKAIRDLFGEKIHQAGSNITSERVRFDFNFDRKLTDEEIKKLEDTVNEKIQENLPVRFEMMPLQKAKEIGAIGLFDDKYSDNVKVYFVGDYSKEFCGGPHVDFTGTIKRFNIIKEESLGRGMRRIYAVVE